jgi:hypothetical protein
MSRLSVWQALWADEGGAILSAELVIVLTIVVLGLITGLACLQQALVAELQDVSAAFSGLNQSYFTPGFRGCWKIWGRTSGTAGSMFIDRRVGLVGGGWGAAGAELGVMGGGGVVGGGGAVTYDLAPRTMGPDVPCETCPPEAALPAPCVTCPPGQASPLPTTESVIPQGPAPQLSPQTW